MNSVTFHSKAQSRYFACEYLHCSSSTAGFILKQIKFINWLLQIRLLFKNSPIYSTLDELFVKIWTVLVGKTMCVLRPQTITTALKIWPYTVTLSSVFPVRHLPTMRSYNTNSYCINNKHNNKWWKHGKNQISLSRTILATAILATITGTS